MRSKFLPFSRPSITEEDVLAVGDVLRSGWITTGPKADEFERAFCRYVGCSRAVALSSATAGMHLVLKSLEIGPGDEVITPSMTWVSTVNLIVLAGATPVFADVDRDTLMVSSDSIKECFSQKTRLVIPVHYAGAAVDMIALRKMADKTGIVLVEDTAHALGTHYLNKHVGVKGTSIFSFHPIKNITTGEGGMFCSDDGNLADHIGRLKFHGLGVDAYDRQMQGRSPQAKVLEPGYKYNMTDVAAVLGLMQLSRIDELNRKRGGLAGRYYELLSEIDEILPLFIPRDTTRHAWHLFVVRLDIDKIEITRDDFMERLKKRNIGTGLHFRAVHLQKYYKESMGTRYGMLPNTEWNSDRIISLPLFPDMNFKDVDDVVAAIKEVIVGQLRKKRF